MKIVLALLAASALAAPAVAAVPIAGLVNSGRNAANTAVSVGPVVDANWTLVGGTAWNGGSNGSFPLAGNWLAENATSRWLTPTANAGTSLDPTADGFYTFQLRFDLTGFQPGTASFAGRFAADNLVSAATLNGAAITRGGAGGFGSWTNFSSGPAVFVNGQNTLNFTLRNLALSSGNPAGLRVEFLSSSVIPVPEPASWAMLITGFGLVGAAARRRRGVVAA